MQTKTEKNGLESKKELVFLKTKHGIFPGFGVKKKKKKHQNFYAYLTAKGWVFFFSLPTFSLL